MTADVDELRSLLAGYEAEVAALEAEVRDRQTRRDALVEQRAQPGVAVHTAWAIDEEVGELDDELRDLLDRKRRPAARATHLRSLLTPIVEREREADRRAIAAAGCEAQLEVAALLERCVPLLTEARRAYTSSAGMVPGGDTSAAQLERLIGRWRETIAPQVREALVGHRQFVQAIPR